MEILDLAGNHQRNGATVRISFTEILIFFEQRVMAAVIILFVLASPATGEDIVYPGVSLGDPLIYFPGANVAANFTPQVGALFSKTSSLNNRVTFSSGIIYVANPGSGRTGAAGDVYGGIGDKAQASGNVVTISGGQVNYVFGGLGAGFGAFLNTVTIGNATVRGAVYGGRIISGSNLNAQQNTVYINPGAIIYDNVYGAYIVASGSYLTMNRVIINGGEVRGSIISGAHAFLSGFTVQGNSVNISGGTINNANIYGGRGQSSAANPSIISNNTVTITGGIINNAYTGKGIYGGQDITGNNAGVQDNIVTISGGTVRADIYGGDNYGNGPTSGNTVTISGGSITGNYIYGGYGRAGSAMENTVTIGGTASLSASFNLYGGYAGSGGNAFTGNTLNKNNAATVSTAQNFEYVNFGYSGAANIGTLDTTPTGTGSARPSVIMNTNSNTVTFGGVITGTGSLTKTGTGALILAGDNNFSDGTVIEGGTIFIAHEGALNRAINPSSNAGLVTFSGTGNKTVKLAPTICNASPPYNCIIEIKNSFRTAAGAGASNYVDLRMPSSTLLLDVYGIDIAGNGGAFNVASGTTMNVDVTTIGFTGNKASGNWNDLNVDGTLNLKVHSIGDEPSFAFFASGISGGGILNISTVGSGTVGFVSGLFGGGDANYDRFKMGSTYVKGSEEDFAVFLLGRIPGTPRLEFTNEVIFDIQGDFKPSGGGQHVPVSAVLIGDGIVTAPVINIKNGAALAPTTFTTVGPEPGTLTLDGNTITLSNFALLYMAYEPFSTCDNSLSTSNDLLNIITPSKEALTLNNGTVYFRTWDNDPIFKGDGNYLIIRSNEGFNGINNDVALNNQLTVNVDGFNLIRNSSYVRGSYAFTLGGDPDSTGGYNAGPLKKNVWFVVNEDENSLNSLSMAWTGIGRNERKPDSGSWESGEFFHSLQHDGPDHEYRFLTGDKVYIYGDVPNLEITLPSKNATISSPVGDLSVGGGYNIIVSGLVVGQDMISGNPTNGHYTINGNGGITADIDSAFGIYSALNYNGNDKLVPTGMLQKYGASTLTFKNTGGNLFNNGIELYGGTVEFTRADQLGDGEEGISFKENSPILRALNSLELANKVTISANITGSFGAAAGAIFTYTGELTGDDTSTFDKSGPGTVRLAQPTQSAFTGKVTVSAGTLEIVGNYGKTTGFTVNGGWLTGAGTIGGPGIIASGGTLQPGSMVTPLKVKGSLAFAAESNFYVDVEYGSGTVGNNKVQVMDGGAVAIDEKANLVLWADYTKIPRTGFEEAPITIIDASDGSAENSEARFVLKSRLPRGFEWEQGWDEATTQFFQLWLSYDPSKGYASIPGGTHNQLEIGKNLDWFVVNRDPGISDIIYRLSDGWDDGQLLKLMDQLHGDLAANALFLAFKEPWRHPFNRLAATSPPYSLPPQNDDRSQPRFWLELTGRYENFSSDGNAHGFSINRPGFAFGLDYPLAPHSILGANFQYTKPRLSQETGETQANDYEFGLYGLTRILDDFDLKAYLGYSLQDYDFKRTVSLPASTHFTEPFYEQLNGATHGESLSASLELTRLIQWQDNIRLLPLAALDYEKAWLSGFTESGGQAALVYGKTSMERLMFRLGLDSEFTFKNGYYLKPKAQFAVRLNDQKYPAVDVRFAKAASPGQPTADIWGVKTGGNYLGLGLGGGLKISENDSFYVSYEAKIYDRATIQSGEAGFMIRW